MDDEQEIAEVRAEPLTAEELDLWGIRAAVARYNSPGKKRTSWKDVAATLGLVEEFGPGTANDDRDRRTTARHWAERAERRQRIDVKATPLFQGETDFEAAKELAAAVGEARGDAAAPSVTAVTVPELPLDLRRTVSLSEYTAQSVAYHGRTAVTRCIKQVQDTGSVTVAVGSGRNVGLFVRSFKTIRNDANFNAIREGVRFEKVTVRSLGGLLAIGSGMSSDGGTFDADFNARAFAGAFIADDLTYDQRHNFESRLQLVEYPLIARKRKDRDIENLKDVLNPDEGLGDIAILSVGVLDEHHHFNEGHPRLAGNVAAIVSELGEINTEIGEPLIAHMCNRYWPIDSAYLDANPPQEIVANAKKLCTKLNAHIRAAALRHIANVPQRIVVATGEGKDAALATLLVTNMGQGRNRILPPTMLITDADTARRVTKLIQR